jgi:hypothetical protein
MDPGELNPKLFDYQRALVEWSLRKGRAADFVDTGLGKTAMQLEALKHLAKRRLRHRKPKKEKK